MTISLESYGRHVIDDDDIAEVIKVLRSDRLTTGPAVEGFERALADAVGAKHAIVCNSGTAALYLAARAAGLSRGDAVIVPSMTFLATASANILAGIEVVFADVNPDTGLMDVANVEEAVARGGHSHSHSHSHVRAIYPVHLAGQVADPAALKAYADTNGLLVIEDACHALGTQYGNGARRVGDGAHALASCFSFHPVKAIAMGEGGAVTTSSDEIAKSVRTLRNHGMTRNSAEFVNRDLAIAGDGSVNPWYYEASEISHNFRASDINCALGLSQIRKFENVMAARRALMAHYRQRIGRLAPAVRLVPQTPGTDPGWHLCTILVDFRTIGIDRRTLMKRLQAKAIGTQVHYIPVHLQPFYRNRYGKLDLPGTMAYYERTLTLPLFASMTEPDVERVVDTLEECIKT